MTLPYVYFFFHVACFSLHAKPAIEGCQANQYLVRRMFSLIQNADLVDVAFGFQRETDGKWSSGSFKRSV